MAVTAIKFRCYHCNQLLGVARAKAGEVVACPKCSAELVVPDPVEPPSQPAAGREPAAPGTTAAFSTPAAPSGTLDTGLGLDLLDIRPEDIRAEPGVRPPAPPPEPEPMPVTVDDAPADEVIGLVEPQGDRPTAPPPTGAPPVPRPAPPPDVAEPVLPPIQLDPPASTAARRRPAPPPVRARDLILPRSVVAAWSLFVLLALGLAFLAGLLAGHYVWRVH